MDTVSTAELIELLLQSLSFIDLQFQYWLSISFAVVVATFLAGKNISRKVRFLISFLYLVTTTLFLVRYMSSLDVASFITQELQSRITSYPIGKSYTLPWRIASFFSGLLATLWFVLLYKHDENDKNDK